MRADARFRRTALLLLAGAALAAASAGAQNVVLDRPLRAGELIVFPDVNDANVYYYVSDKPKLATDAAGRPQFSFLRFVENVRSGAGEPEAREGEGGGIVHALVALSVSQEQLGEAQRELQRVRAGARIQGPVVFESGRFGLVSSVRDAQGGLSTQVLGLGSAPILDGEKAAVSVQLTKRGAKILWESFNSPAPDVSFSFEMELAGYRAPHRALIEADFDQIYEHQGFAAGIASTYLAAEIRGTFDDLRRQGAIKLTQVGDDEKLEALITTAYNKIADMMFQPLQGTGTPDLASLDGGVGGQASLLDRATTMLTRNRDEARRENERIRRENREAEERAEARRREAGGQDGGPQQGAGSGTGQPAGGGQSGQPADGRQGGQGAAGGEQGSESQPPLHARQRGVRAPSRPLGGGGGNGEREPERQEEVTTPSFAVVAAYEMKRIRQRGTFRIDLNKYTSDSLTLRFDENIGDLRSLRGDQSHFREVNLDDPLFVQREVVAFLDGLNSQDFGQYVNFVTVEMKKRHAGGQESHDEVRIDRNNFNAAGNNFKLLYGWKGDNDRRRWTEYDYRTLWSFQGGHTVEQPWRTTTFGAIPLVPPYQRRVVTLEADAAAVTDAQVRSITVKLFYDLGSGEQVKQVTLNAAKGQLSERIEFMLPADRVDYQYEITWRLRGDRTVTSGRRSGSDAVLFVDELPEA